MNFAAWSVSWSGVLEPREHPDGFRGATRNILVALAFVPMEKRGNLPSFSIVIYYAQCIKIISWKEAEVEKNLN